VEAQPLRAVLFDLDGVIVDSREHHMRAWERWATEHGIKHAPDYFHRVFGMRNDAIIGGLRSGLSPSELQPLAERKEELFRELARGHVEALPAVLDVLDRLDERGIPKAVVTSTPRRNLDLILESLGIAHRFGALVAEEDAAKGKPHPEGFLVASERLAVEPARCVVIEDAPAGLAAAKAAGMRAAGVTTTHPASELHDADVVVASLDEPALAAFLFG
jgi:beta-phosphoglucomutase family hydrolase